MGLELMHSLLRLDCDVVSVMMLRMVWLFSSKSNTLSLFSYRIGMPFPMTPA